MQIASHTCPCLHVAEGQVDRLAGKVTRLCIAVFLSCLAGRRLQQTATEAGTRFPSLGLNFPTFPNFPDFPALPLVMQRTPAGTLGTGSQTSGQGSFSSSSSTVGGVTQTTTSQGGGPPVTTTTQEPTG